MNLQEIEVRMAEIKTELIKEDCDVTTLETEVSTLEERKVTLVKEAELRQSTLDRIANSQTKPVEKFEKEERKEETKMNREEVLKSKEYRSAWAKKLMGRSEADFTIEETRALGDAITTTATTFVASESSVAGINNGGLFIPNDVRMDILGLIEKVSPFYRDIRKLAVAGNIDLPFMKASDDAEWYTENTNTKNEGMEFAKLSLTGHELAKNVVVTWKLEAMAVEAFITFITAEIANKMAKALVTAVIYGNGSGKATGAIYNLVAVEGVDPIDTIVQTYKSLDSDFRIGAKAYISTDVNIDIVGYKDGNDNYPFLNGVSATKLVTIEVDPFLADGDIIVGNAANYILNAVEQVSVVRESSVVGRKTIYGAYGIFDGKPRTGAFAKGSYVAEISA